MNRRQYPAFRGIVVLPIALWVIAGSAHGASEIKGAAILDHPCGKVAVKQVGLIHAGKFDDANMLSTREMQEQWKAMPAKDKAAMSGLATAMSPTQEQFTATVKAGGVLVVDGPAATLTTTTTTKDANGSSTETTTQKFKITGAECLVSR